MKAPKRINDRWCPFDFNQCFFHFAFYRRVFRMIDFFRFYADDETFHRLSSSITTVFDFISMFSCITLDNGDFSLFLRYACMWLRVCSHRFRLRSFHNNGISMLILLCILENVKCVFVFHCDWKGELCRGKCGKFKWFLHVHLCVLEVDEAFRNCSSVKAFFYCFFVNC